jgi:C-terminal processing protease CtpA/Prc
MVLRLLPLTLLLYAASAAAQAPAKAPTRVPTPALVAVEGHAGWFGFRYDIVRDSLVVIEVAAGSPADRAGLRKGDWITLIDGQRANPTTLREKPAVPGDVRKLTVRRGTETLGISMIAVAPPPGTLLPTRVAGTNADTVAREARALRGEMAQKATRAAVAPLRADTVVLRPTPAQRKMRGDAERGTTLKLLETYRDTLRPRMLLDDTVYTSMRLLLQQMKHDTVSGLTAKLLADSALYTELALTVKNTENLLTKLSAHGNALAGAEFEHLNPGLAEYFGGVAEGVFVLRVAPGTPAATAGLQPGDIVETLNGERVETIAALRAGIAESSGPLTLHVIRKGRPATLVLRKE